MTQESALPLRPVTDSLALFRSALQRVGYSQETIAKVLGLRVTVMPGTRNMPYYLRRLHAEDPATAIIKIFFLGLSARLHSVQEAIAPATVEQLEATGIVTIQQEWVSSDFRLVPYDGLFFASDRGFGSEFVLGVDPASIQLANLTIRRKIATALDLGTGCGIQALLAARHSDHVIATDISCRALNFTAFNAELNGMQNVECRYGSLFQPVEGLDFDLVVSHPPFIISPEAQYVFRDSGPDALLCREVVNHTPSILRTDGYASILIAWPVRTGEELFQTPETWLDQKEASHVLLHNSSDDPLSYASFLNSDQRLNPRRFDETLNRWVTHFQESAIESIAFGAVIIHRRLSAGSVIREVASRPHGPAAAEQIARMMDAAENQPANGTEGLLAARLRPAGYLDGTISMDPSASNDWQTQLSLAEGVGFSVSFPGQLLRLLPLLDGGRSVKEAALHADLPLDSHPASQELVSQAVQQLLYKGILERASG